MSPRQTLTLSLDTLQRTMESGKRQVKLLGVKKKLYSTLDSLPGTLVDSE